MMNSRNLKTLNEEYLFNELNKSIDLYYDDASQYDNIIKLWGEMYFVNKTLAFRYLFMLRRTGDYTTFLLIMEHLVEFDFEMTAKLIQSGLIEKYGDWKDIFTLLHPTDEDDEINRIILTHTLERIIKDIFDESDEKSDLGVFLPHVESTLVDEKVSGAFIANKLGLTSEAYIKLIRILINTALSKKNRPHMGIYTRCRSLVGLMNDDDYMDVDLVVNSIA